MLLLGIAGTLGACAATSQTPSGRWVGPVTPQPGTSCPATRGVATVRAGQFTFAPNEGTWVLTGTAGPDGTLSAERTRPGADHKPYMTRFTGTWTEATIDGTYVAPGCTFTVKLGRLP